MAIQASTIITRVRNLLVDNDPTQRWTDAELLSHLSDGQRTVAALAEDEVNKIAVMKLTIGTRQALPSDGVSLLGITRNMGTDGLTPGRAVRIIRRDIIDDQNPNWHADTKCPYTYNYLYDPLDSQAFFVYPPSNGAGYIELNYTFVPPELSATSSYLTVPDVFATPLVDYVMFRAHQKDADSSGGRATAQMYLSIFQLFMQGFTASETEANPNVQTSPFDPKVQGSGR